LEWGDNKQHSGWFSLSKPIKGKNHSNKRAEIYGELYLEFQFQVKRERERERERIERENRERERE